MGGRSLATYLARELGPAEWMDHARCRNQGADGNRFFSECTSSGRMTGRVLEAKRWCARCDVRPQCLAFGIEDEYGIFGGSTPEERTALGKDQQALLELHAAQMVGQLPPAKVAENMWASLARKEEAS